jgi:hypothetical protein
VSGRVIGLFMVMASAAACTSHASAARPSATPSAVRATATEQLVEPLATHGIECQRPTPALPDQYRPHLMIDRCGSWTAAVWDSEDGRKLAVQMTSPGAVLEGPTWRIRGDGALLSRMQKIIGGVMAPPG